MIQARRLAWAALAFTATASAGDGPGGVVFPSNVLNNLPWHLGVKSLGLVTEGLTTAGNVPIPVILRDSSLRLYWPSGSELGRLGVPAGLGPVRWAGVTRSIDAFGRSVLPWCIALGEDGSIRQWSNRGSGFVPAGGPWRQVTVGSTNAVGISAEGSIVAWNFTGSLVVAGAPASASVVAAGRGWGMAVDPSGRAQAFGLGSGGVPAIAPVDGVRSVAVNPLMSIAATDANPGLKAALLKQDGSLVTGSAAPMSAGPYTRIAWVSGSSPRVVALRVDGNVEIVTNTGVVSTVVGCFDDVWGGTVSNLNYAAIWSEDCDGDGEPDAEQIRRGEIPDVNGDLVDDRRQPPAMLLDEDSNGTVDGLDTSTAGWKHGRIKASWHLIGGIAPRREVMMTALRVKPGAEVIDRVTWHSMQNAGIGGYTFPPTAATLHVWADPNGDGLPHDCTEVVTAEVTIVPGRNVFEIAPVRVGEAGDLVFVGMSWIHANTSFNGPGMGGWMTTNATDPSDPVRPSRRKGLAWGAAVTDVAMNPTAIVRAQFASRIPDGSNIAYGHFEHWGYLGELTYAAMSPSWAIATDCDRNGILDSLDLADTFWGPRIDADGNGRIDACEGDCDGDGEQDLDAVLGGAEDCDRDLRPDACAHGKEGPPDCDADGTPDACEGDDCDGNGVPDGCDLEMGAADVDGNGVLDACQRDCDRDGTPDGMQLASGASDCNGTGWIDACESPDCDADGVADVCEMLVAGDCNNNGIPDDCDIASGIAAWDDQDGDGRIDMCEFGDGSETDCDGNGMPDSADDPAFSDCDGDGQRDLCEVDCDDNGLADVCEVLSGAADCNGNGVIDACDPDCDEDGLPDACEIAEGAADCDGNGIPDQCEPDHDGDGTIDACEFDCNGNDFPDEREIAEWGAEDVDGDLILDSCERQRADLTLNGVVDGSDLGTLLGYWAEENPPLGDFDGNGFIDGLDLGYLLGNWGSVQW